jgi:hypothetical protein
MGAGGSIPEYNSIEEAKAAGKTQEEIDKYLSEHSSKTSHKRFGLPGIRWTPPSMQDRAYALKRNLKELQNELATKKLWTVEQRQHTLHHLSEAKIFLDSCKSQATNQKNDLKQVRAKLETRYVKMYSAMQEMIMEDPSWNSILQVGQKLMSKNVPTFCQSRNGLVPMYEDAVTVKPTFDTIFGDIATATGGEFLSSSMKRMFRALEKTVMKQDSDPNLNRADNVCDVVRGMITYENFTNMLKGITAMTEHKDIVHMRTKCRFLKPTSGGWMDHVTNVRFSSDRNSHVCEIQFVHKQLLVVREQLGGHEVYNYFRSAMELLDTLGLLKTASSDAGTTSSSSPSSSTISVGITNVEKDMDPLVWLENQGVHVKVDLSEIFAKLNVHTVHDLATCSSDNRSEITSLMKKNNQKKWATKNIEGKLQQMLSEDTLGPLIAARSIAPSTSVSEWLAVLSLSEDSGLKNWLEDEGYEDEVEDFKGLDESDVGALLAATDPSNRLLVELALTIMKGLKVPEECTSLEEAIQKARLSNGKITTISLGEMKIEVSDRIEIDFPLQIIGIGQSKSIINGAGLKIIASANQNERPVTIKYLTLQETDRSAILNSNGMLTKLDNVCVCNCKSYGVTAEKGGRIEMVNCIIKNNGYSGIYVTENSTVVVSGQNTLIKGNVTSNENIYYGLHASDEHSRIQIMRPLSKIHISSENMGGGNWGGSGTIIEWAELQNPEVVRVPEECGTLAHAISRAAESNGRIKTVKILPGTYDCRMDGQKQLDISIPISIIGTGDPSNTIIEGIGLLFRKPTEVNHSHALARNAKITTYYCDSCRREGRPRFTCTSGCNFDLCDICFSLRKSWEISPKVVLRNVSIQNTPYEANGIEVKNGGYLLRLVNVSVINSGFNGIAINGGRCEMESITVKGSKMNGLFLQDGVSFGKISGNSKIIENCSDSDVQINHYGVKVAESSGEVQIIKPLSKASLSFDNMGGGNFGGPGIVQEWSEKELLNIYYINQLNTHHVTMRIKCSRDSSNNFICIVKDQQRRFLTCGLTCVNLVHGSYYYEFELLDDATNYYTQLGWYDVEHFSMRSTNHGIGDDEGRKSWAIDGGRQCYWCAEKKLGENTGWKKGTIVGCYLTLNKNDESKNSISYTFDGVSCGEPPPSFRGFKVGSKGIQPGFTSSYRNYSIRFHAPFKFPPISSASGDSFLPVLKIKEAMKTESAATRKPQNTAL